MKFHTVIFVSVLSCCAPVTTGSLKFALVNGFQVLAQFIQDNDTSPLTTIVNSLSTAILQNPKSDKGDEASDDGAEHNGVWNGIFRTLGFRSSQFPTLAFNILLFIVNMVRNSFPNNKFEDSREFIRERPLLEVIMSQPKVSRLMSQMQDPHLMDKVLREVEAKLGDENENKSDCTVQLVCRSTPIVRGMQTSLMFFLRQKRQFFTTQTRNRKKGETLEDVLAGDEENDLEQMSRVWKISSPLERFFTFMPSFQEFKTAAAFCRKKYPNC